MRGRRIAQLTPLLLALALLAGCDDEADANPPRRLPAAAAGIACQLVEYDVVFAGLGVRFDTAGGAHQDDTVTCALTQSGTPYPYLTLAITPSTASEVIFKATLIPAGGTPVTELGRVAYQVPILAGDGSGPGVEVCWLSATQRLIVMRYVFPAGTPADEVTAITTKLLKLAQLIETSLPA